MIDFATFYDNLTRYGLAMLTSRHYGPCRGVVANNKDPQKLGRVQAVVPSVGQTTPLEKWILPSYAGAGRYRGLFFPPEEGDTIWVFFKEGDPSYPEMYLGGFFGKTDASDGGPTDVPRGMGQKSPDVNPEYRGITTRAGHTLLFCDEKDNESIVLMWHKPDANDPTIENRAFTADIATGKRTLMAFDKDGGFSVTTPEGHALIMNNKDKTVSLIQSNGEGKTGNSLNFNKDGSVNILHKSGASLSIGDKSIDISADPSANMKVNLSGASVVLNAGAVLLGAAATDSAVLGLKLIKWLATHTHGTGVGPSSPPIVPPTPADFCSTSVKVQ